jgi:hypothetical protein
MPIMVAACESSDFVEPDLSMAAFASRGNTILHGNEG